MNSHNEWKGMLSQPLQFPHLTMYDMSDVGVLSYTTLRGCRPSIPHGVMTSMSPNVKPSAALAKSRPVRVRSRSAECRCRQCVKANLLGHQGLSNRRDSQAEQGAPTGPHGLSQRGISPGLSSWALPFVQVFQYGEEHTLTPNRIVYLPRNCRRDNLCCDAYNSTSQKKNAAKPGLYPSGGVTVPKHCHDNRVSMEKFAVATASSRVESVSEGNSWPTLQSSPMPAADSILYASAGSNPTILPSDWSEWETSFHHAQVPAGKSKWTNLCYATLADISAMETPCEDRLSSVSTGAALQQVNYQRPGSSLSSGRPDSALSHTSEQDSGFDELRSRRSITPPLVIIETLVEEVNESKFEDGDTQSSAGSDLSDESEISINISQVEAPESTDGVAVEVSSSSDVTNIATSHPRDDSVLYASSASGYLVIDTDDETDADADKEGGLTVGDQEVPTFHKKKSLDHIQSNLHSINLNTQTTTIKDQGRNTSTPIHWLMNTKLSGPELKKIALSPPNQPVMPRVQNWLLPNDSDTERTVTMTSQPRQGQSMPSGNHGNFGTTSLGTRFEQRSAEVLHAGSSRKRKFEDTNINGSTTRQRNMKKTKL